MEIGSEFSYDEQLGYKNMDLPKEIKDYMFTFCGRTSIETILKNEPNIKKVMLPSYCCDSMIEPFRRKGIEVSFYDVNYKNGLQINLKLDEDIDAILWCNYFGFTVEMPNLKSFINSGGVIIEDITHSFYSKKPYNKQSHYLVASIRKWEAVLCGGFCATTIEKLKNKPCIPPSETFLEIKKRAMILKKQYLEEKIKIEKSEFLNLFSKSNSWLASNYSGLTIDQESLNILKHINYDKHIAQRRTNAKVLYEGLKGCKNIDFLFSEDKMACPLFVPILVKNGYRDRVRKLLIENDIYCPIHWPCPQAECKSNLYDTELSLICDHRYTEKDMLKIVEVIKKFERNIK